MRLHGAAAAVVDDGDDEVESSRRGSLLAAKFLAGDLNHAPITQGKMRRSHHALTSLYKTAFLIIKCILYNSYLLSSYAAALHKKLLKLPVKLNSVNGGVGYRVNTDAAGTSPNLQRKRKNISKLRDLFSNLLEKAKVSA